MFRYYSFFKGFTFIRTYGYIQDSSGWTPLMIASSLRDADDIVDLLLNKEADVDAKSKSRLFQNWFYVFSSCPLSLV